MRRQRGGGARGTVRTETGGGRRRGKTNGCEGVEGRHRSHGEMWKKMKDGHKKTAQILSSYMVTRVHYGIVIKHLDWRESYLCSVSPALFLHHNNTRTGQISVVHVSISETVDGLSERQMSYLSSSQPPWTCCCFNQHKGKERRRRRDRN